MNKNRNVIENKYNVCKQKAEQGWEEGEAGGNSVP
jgi:hypothetical protein